LPNALLDAFTTAGNSLRATSQGFLTAHEPAHQSRSGECVTIDAEAGTWYCFSCQQGGGLIQALVSLQGLAYDEAEALAREHGERGRETAGSGKTQAELLIEAAGDTSFFHDEQYDGWAIVRVGEHQETLRLRDRGFKLWLIRQMYTATGRTPNADALSQALSHFEAKARYDGPQRLLSCRVAAHGAGVLYDLADAEWRVVRITPEGWEVVQQPGVFRRGSNTAPQVLPESGGTMADLLPFLPAMSGAAKLLAQVYPVTCLVPDVPHPIPQIVGQKGAAKSTLCRVFRRLVDPAREELLSLPNDPNELALLLSRNYAPVFDNLDNVLPWQSDMLCRACTGGGITKRKLYTDDEEVVLSFRRCVVMNGIQPGATRPDLLDRTLPISLEPMASSARREETEFWARFDAVRPRLVGAMFDALAQAIRLYPTVQLSNLPRMSDFARWGFAVAEALGLGGPAFLTAYTSAIGDQNTVAIENHAVATAVLSLLGGREAIDNAAEGSEFWKGTAADLLTALDAVAATQRIDVRSKAWPKAAHILTRRLNEVKSNLLDIGIKFESRSDGTARQVTFWKYTGHSVSSVSSVKGEQNQPVDADAAHDATAEPPASSVSRPPESLTLREVADATVPPPDARTDAVASGANGPFDNGLDESAGASDSTDTTFDTLREGGHIEVGVSNDGPLPDYIVSAAQLDAVIPMLCESPVLSVDVETTGLGLFTDRVRLVQFATPDRVIVVDADRCPIQRLAPVFTAPHLLAYHNSKFDLKMLRAAGLPWPTAPVFDTMLAAQLLGASTEKRPKGYYGLEAVVQRYLGLDLDKTLQTSDWRGALSASQVCYAARDAEITLQLVPILQQALADANLARVSAIEFQCVLALAWLEMSGAPIDVQRWRDRAVLESHQAQAMEAELHGILHQSRNGASQLFPDDINWRSPRQVLTLLQHRGHAVPNTASPTLTALVDADPLIPALLRWREAAKRAGTYGLPWLDNAINPVTGRVHADYAQLGSTAGRMSCSKPNFQNLPRSATYRSCVAAAPGSCIVKADYSQIELRIAALIAQDVAMLTAYRMDEDLHVATAARILGIAPEQATKEQRQLAKPVNFGLIYGMGPKALQQKVWKDAGIVMSLDDAALYRQRFFEAYPDLHRWQRTTGNAASTETRTLAGRRRLDVTAFTERLNSPIQRTGADGFKLALARLFAHRHEVPDTRLVAVIHDEVLAECPVEAADATAQWLQRHMVAAMSEILCARVPVVVETSTGQDWAGTPVGETGTT
jgi:DNA polymerase I-like protein with 3'-5' exonuclease and polymerase domains